MYVNGKMRPLETIPGIEGEGIKNETTKKMQKKKRKGSQDKEKHYCIRKICLSVD
jgi:hypothetical protein